MKKCLTTEQVLAEVRMKKPVSRASLYNYFRKLRIEPVGELRQCPQLYPADTAKRILHALGLS